MPSKVSRLDIFPTFVFDTTLANCTELNRSLTNAIRSERDRDKIGIERSNSLQLGGWHSKTALHKEAEFTQLALAVRDVGREISTQLGYHPSVNLDIDMMWAIVNGPGAYNVSHIHPGSLWSGVYYVQMPESGGSIEFTDPRTANLMHQARYEDRPADCHPARIFDSNPGRMLVFPSWLYHSVHPNLSDEDRIIVSFNLSIRS